MRVRTAAASVLACGASVSLLAGLLATPASAAEDVTPPTITFVSRTAPNAAGWNNTDVVVTWSCEDEPGGSGAVWDTVSTTVTAEGVNLSAVGTCMDHAGNTASAQRLGINIDKTPPTATGTAERSPDTASGWYIRPVTFSFQGSDALSGLVGCSSSYTYSYPDSASASVLGQCSDQAGNSKVSAASFQYDSESPGGTVDSNGPVTLPPCCFGEFGGGAVNYAPAGASITGKASDSASGVSEVLVYFTRLPHGDHRLPAPVREAPVIREAALASPGMQHTTWSASTAGMKTGGYRVQVQVIDAVGHVFPYENAYSQGYVITG